MHHDNNKKIANSFLFNRLIEIHTSDQVNILIVCLQRQSEICFHCITMNTNLFCQIMNRNHFDRNSVIRRIHSRIHIHTHPVAHSLTTLKYNLNFN